MLWSVLSGAIDAGCATDSRFSHDVTVASITYRKLWPGGAPAPDSDDMVLVDDLYKAHARPGDPPPTFT